jgi:hypothetical protein
MRFVLQNLNFQSCKLIRVQTNLHVTNKGFLQKSSSEIDDFMHSKKKESNLNPIVLAPVSTTQVVSSNKSLYPSILQKNRRVRPQIGNPNSKSSNHIRVHKDLFDIFEPIENEEPLNVYARTSKAIGHKNVLLTQRNTQLGQTNVDKFNMNLLSNSNAFTPVGMHHLGPLRVRKGSHKIQNTKKATMNATLSSLKVIKSFVNAHTFV